MAEYVFDPKSNQPSGRRLPMKCQLCGKESQICCMLFLGDWHGLACPECIDQVANSQQRKFCRFLEQTESAE